MKIQESAENYLETILILTNKNGAVRSIDIANAMNFTKPSVSVAMKNLREDKCIQVDSDGYIKLTAKGKEIAEKILERHNIFTNWLVKMGVDKKIAVEDACRIEHVISAESFKAIKQHIEKEM